MLAASPPGSNMAPNDLQAAPFMVSARIAAKQLRKPGAIGCSQTQPNEFLQHDTARFALARLPFLMIIKHRHRAIRVQPNGEERVESTLQDAQFVAPCDNPQHPRECPQARSDVQYQNQDQSGRDQQAARAENENS